MAEPVEMQSAVGPGNMYYMANEDVDDPQEGTFLAYLTD